MPVDSKTELAQYVSDSRKSYEADLKTLVDLAGVSMDPERKPEILRTAESAAALIKRMGGQAEIVQTKGNPVIERPEHHFERAGTARGLAQHQPQLVILIAHLTALAPRILPNIIHLPPFSLE